MQPIVLVVASIRSEIHSHSIQTSKNEPGMMRTQHYGTQILRLKPNFQNKKRGKGPLMHSPAND